MASRSTTRTSKQSTSSKTSTSTKAVAPASKPELEVVTEIGEAQIALPVMKKRELMQLVAAQADLSNKKVKPVMEAMLQVLGDAIAEGRELNLQPFGRMKINRQKDVGHARVTVAKIRQVNTAKSSEVS